MKFFLQTTPFLLITAVLMAQVLGERLAAMVTENAKLLHQYTCQQRTEVLYKGEQKLVRLSQVHFDAGGKRQLTLISQEGGEEPKGPLRRAIADKMRAEIKDYVDRLGALIETYLPPDPAKLKAALATAELVPTAAGVQVRMKNYLKPGDNVVLTINTATRKLQRIELSTTLDSDPISVTADMATVPDGPNYPSFTKVESPARNLEIRLSQSDFVKL